MHLQIHAVQAFKHFRHRLIQLVATLKPLNAKGRVSQSLDRESR